MSTCELTLAHSPDSDDLVMWWPLTGLVGPDGVPIEEGIRDQGSGTSKGGEKRPKRKRGLEAPLHTVGHPPAIDCGGFTFACIAQDVETLNKRAIAAASLGARAGGGGHVPEAAYDITAISCHTYPHIKDAYQITASGGSFGEGYGPKVVVKASRAAEASEWLATGARGWRVAVPGVNTTAFLTLSLMLGSTADAPVFEVIELPFEEVAPAVVSGQADAGLLIHEAQLTFEEMGLTAIADVGAWWQTETGRPLPLGLNVIRRDLDDRFGEGTCEKVAGVLAASIRHCVERGDLSRQYLVAHSQDRPEWRDAALVDKYLAMYVSERTLDMGEAGREAIAELLGRGHEAGLCPEPGVIDAI
jgi:5,8-dihydroxy-2-naphthoate synthase